MPKPPAPPPEFFVDRNLGRHIVGWIVLTKDERITRCGDEQQALIDSQLRVFAMIGNQHLTGPQQATYYVTNIHRIALQSRKPGPFVRHRAPRPRRAPLATVSA